MFGRFAKNSIIVIVLACCIVGLTYAASVFSSGERVVGELETIHAIPYPVQNGSTIIQEKLAHADIFMNAPVFAKKLVLTIQFNPGNTTSIDAGIRTGTFWLGYDKQPLYRKAVNSPQEQTKVLTFPLTADFQATDQSIDLMLFSSSPQSSSAVEEADRDTVSWSIESIHATVYPMMPTIAEVKDYIKSIWNKERDI